VIALIVASAGAVSQHGAAYRSDCAAADRCTYRCAASSAHRLGPAGTSGNPYD